MLVFSYSCIFIIVQILPQGHHHPYLAPNVLHPSGVNFSNFAGYPPSIASFSTGSQRGPQQVTDQMPPRCASEPIISNLEPSESQGVHPPACRCSSYLSQVLKQMKESAEQGVTEPEFELSWNNEDNTVFKYKVRFVPSSL